MAYTTLHLVRHAHATWTPDEGRPLSVEGRAGAAHVAALLGDEPIVAIYASTAQRAAQTVEPLARSLGLSISPVHNLRERRLSDGLVADHGAAVAWCWANPQAALPGGESNVAARQRGEAVVTELVRRHPGQTVVVGTHGNLIALILQHWLPAVDHAFWARLTMPDIYTLTLHKGGAALTRLWEAGDRFVPAPREDR